MLHIETMEVEKKNDVDLNDESHLEGMRDKMKPVNVANMTIIMDDSDEETSSSEESALLSGAEGKSSAIQMGFQSLSLCVHDICLLLIWMDIGACCCGN